MIVTQYPRYQSIKAEGIYHLYLQVLREHIADESIDLIYLVDKIHRTSPPRMAVSGRSGPSAGLHVSDSIH